MHVIRSARSNEGQRVQALVEVVRTPPALKRLTAVRGRDGQTGQGLVEFALVVPILAVLFMAVFETALALNAVVGVNRASQQAAHTAAIMGSRPGSDCMILRDVEEDVTVPNDRTKITEVIIERTAMVGNTSYQKQTYHRTGTLADCVLPDGSTIQVPYELDPASDYPESVRCSTLTGCPAMGLVPARSTVDNIGVNIRYRHLWATPLNAIYGAFGGGDVGWSIAQRNIFRMEPIL
jgi:Flp pilus assembly protein TadG